MNLTFVKSEAVDRLHKNLSSNLDAYLEGNFARLLLDSDIRRSRIVVGDTPQLTDDNLQPKSDSECARIIYQWLSILTPAQASDQRLWCALTHTLFSEYMNRRWGSNFLKAEKKHDLVVDRWFFKGEGSRTKMHNGIARLWWFGYVSYDSKRSDPFELTDVLLSLQDIQTAFLERSIGMCRPLLQTALEAIKKNEHQLASVNRGAVVKEWAKDIKLRGGVFLLDSIPPDRLKFVVEQGLLDRIAGKG